MDKRLIFGLLAGGAAAGFIILWKSYDKPEKGDIEAKKRLSNSLPTITSQSSRNSAPFSTSPLASSLAASPLASDSASRKDSQTHVRSASVTSAKPEEVESPTRRASVLQQQTIIEHADELYSQEKHFDIYALLSQFVSNNRIPLSAESDPADDGETPATPEHFAEVLWRLARACRDTAESGFVSTKEQKRDLIFQGLNYARKAIECDPNSGFGHKWTAILTSATGDFEGTKQKIANAYVIRDHIAQAISLEPNDGTSHHVYGVWCESLASLSWVERKVASAIFGTPPTSTYEEALQHFLRAEEVQPGFWNFNVLKVTHYYYNSLLFQQCHIQIAQMYQKLGDKENARRWAEQLISRPIKSEEDRESKETAEAILRKL